MKDYIFILGRDTELSLLEIVSYLKARGINFTIKDHNEHYALFSLSTLDISKISSSLAGTIKMGEVVDNLNNLYMGDKNKIVYSLNIFGADEEFVSSVESELKSYFKKEKLKAITRKNLERKPSRSSNIDLELILFKNKVAKVLAVFNPKEYKARDEKRPYFDAAQVISLRLAKILINLGQLKEGQTMLDPFCGTASIMQEAALQGINTIGIDNDKRTLDQAEKNLEWLGKKYFENWKLMPGDARKLAYYVKKVDSVVTEPYLGPYFKENVPYDFAVKLKAQLENLYTAVLKEIHKVVRNKVVFIFPRFKTKIKQKVSLNIDRILLNSGFKVYSPLDSIKIPIPYYHKLSHVERFIYILEKC
ncbi:MAG TPA: methyltransferase domain-containing protein [Candidatus Nanoarchaeia archaeon]|nr:methyltransferase domain-containing protein [Candidatus Nanoarchaeia archaeon]